PGFSDRRQEGIGHGVQGRAAERGGHGDKRQQRGGLPLEPDRGSSRQGARAHPGLGRQPGRKRDAGAGPQRLPGGGMKASLVTEDGSKELQFRFNPKEYSISKAATWNRPTNKGAKHSTTPEFGGV